jgi:hypothetical protein
VRDAVGLQGHQRGGVEILIWFHSCRLRAAGKTRLIYVNAPPRGSTRLDSNPPCARLRRVRLPP